MVSFSIALFLLAGVAAQIVGVVNAQFDTPLMDQDETTQHLRRRVQVGSAPAPSPSFLIEATEVPTLSPVIIEYWSVVGDGFYRPPAVGGGVEEDVPDDQQAAAGAVEDGDATTQEQEQVATVVTIGEKDDTATTGANNEPSTDNNINDKNIGGDDDDNTNLYWIIIAACVGAAAIVLALVLFPHYAARRHGRQSMHDKGSKSEKVEPTERELSEHPHIEEITVSAVEEDSSATSSV
jgi:hypothetical protein